MIRHPTSLRLIAYVDKSLSARDESRIKAHLVGCTECRLYVQRVREVLGQAKRAPALTAPDDALERIMKRWDAGDRVILPVADPPTKQIRLVKPVAGAAAAILAVASVAVFSTGARADHSDLRFHPERPERGATIQVEYQSTSLLGAEDNLVLRARLRTPASKQYNRQMAQAVVANLKRGRGGRYTGTFVLPKSVVYGVFAVENRDADRVDSNGRRLWELLTHVDSVPEYAALQQRSYDLTGRNWELAFNTARQATVLYPQNPTAWAYLSSFENALFGVLHADSIRKLNSERFTRLHEVLAAQSSLDDEELAGMYWVALVADRASDATEYWRRRLHAEAPYHPLAVQDSANRIAAVYSQQPTRALREFENLWATFGKAHAAVPVRASSVARTLGDHVEAKLWADRLVSVDPWRALDVALDFLDRESLRHEGFARLRRELVRFEHSTDESRDLIETRGDWLAGLDKTMRQVNGAFGRELLTAGFAEEGIESLELSASGGWDRSVFESLGLWHLKTGDTAAGIHMLARAAVDPSIESSEVDSLEAMALQFTTPHEWSEAQTRAHAMMMDRTFEEAVFRELDQSIPLLGEDRKSTTLGELTGGSVSVVAFVRQHCAPALEELATLQNLAGRLDAAGATVVTIVDEEPSDALRRLLAGYGFTLPIYYDPDREASNAFNSWTTPEYYVLDRQGRIAFELVDWADVERYVSALSISAPTLVAP